MLTSPSALCHLDNIHVFAWFLFVHYEILFSKKKKKNGLQIFKLSKKHQYKWFKSSVNTKSLRCQEFWWVMKHRKCFPTVTKVCHHPGRMIMGRDYNVLTSSSLISLPPFGVDLNPFSYQLNFFLYFVREDEAIRVQSLVCCRCSVKAVQPRFLLILCNCSPDMPDVTFPWHPFGL